MDNPAAAQRRRGVQNRPRPENEENPMKRTGVAAAAAMALLAPLAMAQDAHLARNLAATCANCHGTDGAARGDMKPLAGVAADKIIAMINDFKSGNTPATIMHQISKGYTDEQIRLVAGYFAAQQPRK
jgi:cytochrome c553